MRPSDIDEITFNAKKTGRMNFGWSIKAELESQFDKFEHWTITKGIEVVALGGVVPLPQNPAIGAIWMLGTRLMDIHWREATRLTRQYINMVRPDWFLIGNIVPKHMIERRRWLEHLGFDFVEEEANIQLKDHVTFWLQPLDGPKA